MVLPTSASSRTPERRGSWSCSLVMGPATSRRRCSANTAGIFRVASADMNGDGKLDLVATGTSFLGVLLRDGAGHFPNPTFFSAPTALELRLTDLERRRPRGRCARDAARRGRRCRGAAQRLRTGLDRSRADRQRLARPGTGRRHADLFHDGHEQRAARGLERQPDRHLACRDSRHLGDAVRLAPARRRTPPWSRATSARWGPAPQPR